MEYFLNIDNESDHEVEYDDQVGDNQESKIDPMWFEVTDDDEVEEEHKVFGKEKFDLEIQTAIDTYDYSLSTESWTDAKEHLEDLLSRVDKYKHKYHETPQAVTEYIRGHTDLAEELEGKSKHDFENPRDFASLKTLHSLIDGLKETYAKEEEEQKQHAEAAEKDDGDEDDSEAAFAKRFLEIVQDRRSAERLNRLARKCGKQGYDALRISALGHYVIAVLEEERSFLVDKSKWEDACHAAEECLALLKANPNITLVEDVRRLEASNNRVAAIMGSLTEVLSSLKTRLLNVSQVTKCSELDYLWVPLAEHRLARLTDETLAYYRLKERNNRRHVIECTQILLSLIGFRTQKAHEVLFQADGWESTVVSESMLETVREIYRVVVRCASQNDEPAKMTAVCYIGYHYAQAGQFRQGRDVLLRSGVPAFIAEKNGCTVELYILYNRVIAQLGLAAFVENQIEESYALLGTLWEKYNPAVLIGQAIPQSKDAEEEIKNRDHTVQHHFEIPHQHLELAAMLSALIIDTVNEAKKPYERSRVQKFFYRAISHPPQLLSANSSSVKDQVYAAHKALKAGDYAGAKEAVQNMKAWKTLSNGDEVLTNYLVKLKEAALRVFCFSNRTSFSTFSVEQLSAKYEMDPQDVRDILNDMIWDSDSLVAHWDRDDTYLYVDRSNPTRLQHLVLGAADSVVELAPYKETRTRANEGRGRGGAGGRGAGGRGRGRGRGGRGN